MDAKVSRKETRLQPSGLVEVLTSNIFDLYPVYGDVYDKNLITDIEILDDAKTELIDRVMFGTVKQRGADPLEPESGVQWAEALLGEVTVPVVMLQIQAEAQLEGPGARIEFGTVTSATGEQYFQYLIR